GCSTKRRKQFFTKPEAFDPCLPLPSLRLLVPPLQLLSAAMWHVVKQKDVMNYWKVQEFVCMVTDAVPCLINPQQRAQLLLGLRARVSSSLCHKQMFSFLMFRLPVSSADCMDPDVKTTESTFVALVQSLLKDPAERAYFFQEVFPAEYGQQYDAALQVLLWELLSRLEKLLPVPDLKQTTAWFISAPSVLEDCIQSSSEELSSVFKHYKSSGLLKMTCKLRRNSTPLGNGPCSTIGSCIMSALSVPPSQKTNLSVGLDSVHNYANTLTRITLAEAGQCSVVAFYTEVEVRASDLDAESPEIQVQTECYEEEIVALRAGVSGGGEEEPGEAAGVAKMAEDGGSEDDGRRKERRNKNVQKHSCHNCFVNFNLNHKRQLVYRSFTGEKFIPSPSSSDEIFTSIKLFPKGNAESQDGGHHAHSKKRSLMCETCGKTFTRTSDVRRHQLTHTGERPFHCSQCDRTFQHSWDLAKHESKHHGVAISFSCQLCGGSFANLRTLTVHHKKSHLSESQLPHICSICSRSFPTDDELLEHRKSHVSIRRYICQQCGDGFDTLLARAQHRQAHQVKRQFKCPNCEKTYTRRSDVKRHLSTHTGERPHQCKQCNKRFSVRFMLVKHLRVHTGERPFQCAHCSKSFTLASVLARHERMHTGEKPFLCSQCGRGFLSQGELSKHHRSHLDDRPYSCPQCEKRFKSKKTQQEHIASHSGARPYPCTHCGKGFSKPYALTRHNLIHTGERPFPCGHCEKSFLTLSEAQLHRRIHTGERPYPCDACELRFKSSSELARHKRSHSGQRREKPTCELCGKTFPSKAKLNKHMEMHMEAADLSKEAFR
uniref:C2H2-type domain-containing protein n=1 Tax=Poecilia reticulata TaxID=8081 RepID=A0A3P9QJN4_POERE